MSAWDGWIGDMLAGLGLPDTGDNKNFLLGWAQTDPSRCKFNPLLASWTASGSTDCRPSPGGLHSQNYVSPDSAVRATRRQLYSGDYVDLLAALANGHPADWNNLPGVVTDLRLWGASGWADQFASNHNLGGASGGTVSTTHATAAWTRWMRALAHRGPESHRRIAKSAARARRIARHR